MVIDEKQLAEVRERRTYLHESAFGPSLGSSAVNEEDDDDVVLLIDFDPASRTASFRNSSGHIFFQIEDPEIVDTKTVLRKLTILLDRVRMSKTAR